MNLCYDFQLRFIGDGANTVLVVSLTELLAYGKWTVNGAVVPVLTKVSFFGTGTTSGGSNINFTTAIDSTGTLVTITFASAPLSNQEYVISNQVG